MSTEILDHAYGVYICQLRYWTIPVEPSSGEPPSVSGFPGFCSGPPWPQPPFHIHPGAPSTCLGHWTVWYTGSTPRWGRRWPLQQTACLKRNKLVQIYITTKIIYFKLYNQSPVRTDQWQEVGAQWRPLLFPPPPAPSPGCPIFVN